MAEASHALAGMHQQCNYGRTWRTHIVLSQAGEVSAGLHSMLQDFPSTHFTFEAWISSSDFCHAGEARSLLEGCWCHCVCAGHACLHITADSSAISDSSSVQSDQQAPANALCHAVAA